VLETQSVPAMDYAGAVLAQENECLSSSNRRLSTITLIRGRS
jgi:hypothetical protein